MLSLRTTTGLSILALAIGIAGTVWLSTLTSTWHGRDARSVALTSHAKSRHHVRHPTRAYGPMRVVTQHRRTAPASPVGELSDAQATAVASPIELIPLSTPSDTSQPWYQLKGHLDGHILLHVTVDGSGRVMTAAMRESSGDPILDDHALRSVHLWRFAVPSDHPDGISGDLPMRFASRNGDVARAM